MVTQTSSPWGSVAKLSTVGMMIFLLASPSWTQRPQQNSEDLGPAGRLAMEALKAHPRGHVGIQMLNLTKGLRQYFEVDDGIGVLIAETKPDGPAARAGLQAGDVVVGLGPETITSSRQLADLVSANTSGTVTVRYVRRGRAGQVSVDIEQREAIVVKLSPSVIRQRIETTSRDGSGQVVTVEHRTDGVASTVDLDLVLDELNVFFSGDGMRRKLDRLEELDLLEIEARIKSLEAELVELEGQLPETASQSEPPQED